jgi:hypothetical protein
VTADLFGEPPVGDSGGVDEDAVHVEKDDAELGIQ